MVSLYHVEQKLYKVHFIQYYGIFTGQWPFMMPNKKCKKYQGNINTYA